MDTRQAALLLFLGFSVLTSPTTFASPITAYFNDFDNPAIVGTGISASLLNVGVPNGAAIQSVQGLGALPQFSGNFLSSYGVPKTITGAGGSNHISLILNNLPAHSSVNISGFLAILDTWDSFTGNPSPDNMDFILDGVNIFRDSYVYLPGTIHANNTLNLLDINGGRVNRGFNPQDDQAFDLGTHLSLIPHTSSSLRLDISANGAGWQGGADEAWGIENLRIELTNDGTTNGTPTPSSLALLLAGFAGLGWIRRFHLYTLLRRQA